MARAPARPWGAGAFENWTVRPAAKTPEKPRTINVYEGAWARFKAPEMIPAVAWTTGITRS